MPGKYAQDEGGGLLLVILLLLAFALLIALPVLQLIMIEYRASVSEQIALQAHYLAEAGLVKAQQLLTFNVAAPLPAGEQALGNGTYSVERVSEREIVAAGRVGSMTIRLALCYEPQELSGGYLVCVGGVNGDGYMELKGTAKAQVAGSVLVDGDLFVDAGALFGVASRLTLTGELLGEGSVTLAPNSVANPLSDELWLWLQERLLQTGSPLPEPQTGLLQLEAGKIYECGAADWVGLQVVGPAEDEPPATVIIRGDLSWQDCRGNINLLVIGDCQQPGNQEGVLSVTGVLWVQGSLTVHNLHVRGALIANCLQVNSGPFVGLNLLVESYPGLTGGEGLIVPRFQSWKYRFE